MNTQKQMMSQMQSMNLLPADITAEAWFVAQRSPDGVICQHCRISERKTVRGKKSQRCNAYCPPFAITTKSVVESSMLGYRVWALLKSGHYGTHHPISTKHLSRYGSEFSGRHNIREADTIRHMESNRREGRQEAEI